MDKIQNQLRRKYTKLSTKDLFRKLEGGTLPHDENNIAFQVAYTRYGITSNLVKGIDKDSPSEKLLEAIKELELQVRMNSRLKAIARNMNQKRFAEQ